MSREMKIATVIANDLGAAEMLSGPTVDAIPVIAKRLVAFGSPNDKATCKWCGEDIYYAEGEGWWAPYWYHESTMEPWCPDSKHEAEAAQPASRTEGTRT